LRAGKAYNQKRSWEKKKLKVQPGEGEGRGKWREGSAKAV